MANFFKTPTQKSTTENAPPSYAAPGLGQLANDTMSLYNSGKGYAQYPGSGVAAMSGLTDAGIRSLQRNANYGNPDALYGSVNKGLLGVSNQGGFNSGQQDALAKMQSLYGGDDSFENAMNASNQKIIDAQNRQAVGLGGYGGTDAAKALGGELASNNAQYNFQNQANKAGLANSLFQGNQQGIANQQSIAGLLPTLNDAKNANANSLLLAGGLRDTYNQNALDDKISRFNTQQGLGRQRIADATGLLTGTAGNYGTSTAKQKGGASPFLQLLGAGIGAIPGLARSTSNGG